MSSEYYQEQAAVLQRALKDTLGDIALSLEILDATAKGLSANSVKGPQVIHAVASYYGLSAKRVARGRGGPIVHCRYVALMVMRRVGMTYPEIGRAVGLHHTTVIIGIRRALKQPVLVAAADLIYARFTGE